MRDAMLIVHFIGIAMGVGTGIGYMFLAMGAKKLEGAERVQFAMNTFSLSKMGQYGLVLLFISGGYLMTPYWSQMGDMPLLMAKLVLFLVLAGLMGMNSAKMRKTTMEHAATNMPKISSIGKVILLISLVIVVLAVMVFH